MNIWDVLILLAVAGMVFGAVRGLRRGGGACRCGGSSGSSGSSGCSGCAGCSGCGVCGKASAGEGGPKPCRREQEGR